ncbi:MAG TPA: GAF domain-containing protein [Frankiaceae bacterium]|nr:GAF domain-containing protein [Frankiaceae bacterium]
MSRGAAALAEAVADVAPAVETEAPAARPAHAGQTDALLGRLCRVVRDVLGVSRATVLVFEDPTTLVPAVSVAREEHDELWQRFRTMRPISLDLSSEAVAALRREAVVVVPDAETSPLVPAEWRTAFGLTSLAVAPLHVDGRPWGALVVDDTDARHEFGARDIRTLAELAGLAATAISATECAAAAAAEAALRTALRESATRLGVTLDLAEAVDGVAPFLLTASGFELIGAALGKSGLARTLKVATTTGYDTDAVRVLKNGAEEAVSSDGRLLVPLRGVQGLIGVLVLRSHGSAAKRLDLVHEVADRFAATIEQVGSAERAATHAADMEHSTVRLSLARQAIGRALRTFRGVGYASGGPGLFSVSSTNHARRALEDLDEVRQVLAAQSTSPALAPALKALLDGVPARTYELAWTTAGAPRPVAPEAEIACLRTALRFANLVRESRGRVLAVRLSFTQDGVECSLSSNGLLRDPAAVAGETGVSDLVGPWIREIGGTAEFESNDAAFSVRFAVPNLQPPLRARTR